MTILNNLMALGEPFINIDQKSQWTLFCRNARCFGSSWYSIEDLKDESQAFIQRWVSITDDGPPYSQHWVGRPQGLLSAKHTTLDQHWTNIGSMSCVYYACIYEPSAGGLVQWLKRTPLWPSSLKKQNVSYSLTRKDSILWGASVTER